MKDDNIQLINDDLLKTDQIEDESIDLIITSPPYNVGIDYNSTNDSMLPIDFMNFTWNWLARCIKWLKPDGRLCLNVPIETNVLEDIPTGANFTQTAMGVGFKYKTTIVWNKNYVKTRTAWGSFASASSPNIIAPFELIIIFYKGREWKKLNKGESTIANQEFIDWSSGIWTFGTASKTKIGHPTPFPIELPTRCLKMFSYKEDTILDPFCGSGTTLIAAHQNNRKAIGIEIDKEYYNLAVNRFKAETAQTSFL